MGQHLSGPPDLTGQVALITGGSGSMGQAIAEIFKSAGAKVIATDISDTADLSAGIEYKKCDVSSQAEVESLIDKVIANYGKVDILVLCAGIITRNTLADSTNEEWLAMH